MSDTQEWQGFGRKWKGLVGPGWSMEGPFSRNVIRDSNLTPDWGRVVDRANHLAPHTAR